jgi:Uma2 family endonuclease
MGYPQKAPAWITPDEYLALEEKASVKHEYLEGVIYAWQGYGPMAMAGGSRAHNEIVQNLVVALRALLRGSGCRTYASDMRLHVEAKSAYFYPDVMVTCAESDLAGDGRSLHQLTAPRVIIEVLSDSTEAFDRGEKFGAYQALVSLREYVLVPTSGEVVQVWRRTGSGWVSAAYQREPVPIESLGIALAPAAVFEGVA